MPRTSHDEETDALVGEVVDGKYRVDAPLGSGGMGTVYRATHVGTGREVALKVLTARLTTHEAAVERFRREARAAGQMRHPNVVDVTDFGFAVRGQERLAYLVMELLQGKTLRGVLEAEGKLPASVAVEVLDQVCAAVAEAHRLGILHRDLKPENIHLRPEGRGYRVKVLDFGIAKLMQADGEEGHAGTPTIPSSRPVPIVVDPSLDTTQTGGLGNATTHAAWSSAWSDGASLTRVGAAIGTPLYMSPEQWMGRAFDARSDVYSLGVMAYEMLAGEPPFLGKKRPISEEHAEVPPPPLAPRAPGVPRRIVSVIEAALAKDPHGRPPSAAAFAAALDEGTETTGKLLRRSITLCTDHFGMLVRHCAPVTVPPLVLTTAGLAVDLLAARGAVSLRVASVVELIGVFGTAVLVCLLFAPVSGLVVPPVATVLASPGSRFPAPSADALWKTTRVALPASLVWAVLLLAGGISSTFVLKPLHFGLGARLFASTILITLETAPFAVFPAVVVMERAQGLSPLRRSLGLLRPVWRAALGVQLLYALLTYALPQLVRLALDPLVMQGRDGSALLEEGVSAYDFLGALLSVVLTPFTLVPPALLYLRAREAEGTSTQGRAPSYRKQ